MVLSGVLVSRFVMMSLHQQAPYVVYIKHYVRVRRDFKRGLVYQPGALLAQHGPPWTVWVAIFIFLLIVWLCHVYI